MRLRTGEIFCPHPGPVAPAGSGSTDLDRVGTRDTVSRCAAVKRSSPRTQRATAKLRSNSASTDRYEHDVQCTI